MRPLLAVDTPWLLYRAFHSLPKSIVGANGEPVGALLGCVDALLGAAESCRPRAVAACFGAEEATHRVALYAGYHANREPMPQALRKQWDRAPALLAAFGCTVETHVDLEADDLLGSLAGVEARAGGETLLLTGDRDLYQAVGEATRVLKLRRGEAPQQIGPAKVEEQLGVGPDQIVDLIALRGDPSDGLPGARGIGAKTAAALLAEHGTLEGVLAAAPKLRPRLAEALREQAEELRCFQQVAELVEVAVERPVDRELDRAGGAAAARELGMVRLAQRLTG